VDSFEGCICDIAQLDIIDFGDHVRDDVEIEVVSGGTLDIRLCLVENRLNLRIDLGGIRTFARDLFGLVGGIRSEFLVVLLLKLGT
jgi:hypothetical protein